MSPLLKRAIKNQAILIALFTFFIISFYFLAIYNVLENENSWFAKWYWLIMGLIFFAFICYSLWGIYMAKKNKRCLITRIANSINRYGFLLKQLVKRDFKRKYKRSILGICWSFLAPLLMMGTQYIVFSTIRGNQSIPYFPIYLFIGIITFKYFGSLTSSGLNSMTGNASLIRKVYVPKYIYLLSNSLSATIDFGFTLIPLVIFMLAMQLWPMPLIILALLNIILIYVFCLGLSMVLATLMVFFRDTKFIWEVVHLAWMYLTPIFYSVENIQNETFRTIVKFNPFYHYLKIGRMLIIDRVSPNLHTFLWALISSVGMFIIGCIVFKSQEKKFSIYV